MQEQKQLGVKNEKELPRDTFSKLKDEEKVPYITTSLKIYHEHLVSDLVLL